MEIPAYAGMTVIMYENIIPNQTTQQPKHPRWVAPVAKLCRPFRARSLIIMLDINPQLCYSVIKINNWSLFIVCLNHTLREICYKMLNLVFFGQFLTSFSKSPANAFLTPLKSKGYNGRV